MALVTVNGRDVLEGHISIPRVGAWHMDFMLDVGKTISTQATATFSDGTSFMGTIIRQAVFADYLRIRAVAGAGTLYSTQVQPKHWKGTPSIPLSVPLNYILSQAGETIAPTSDQSTLNTQLPSWTCLPQSASAAVRSIIKGYADTWRMLPSGLLWVGTEQWPTVDGPGGAMRDHGNYFLLHQRTDIGRMELAEDSSTLRPGTVFRGVRISRVDNYIKPNEFRTVAHYFETPT